MLSLNETVGIIRYGSFGHVQYQGLYTVTKINKTRIHVQRVSDNYERIFSAHTGIEKGSERYRSAEIVSVGRYNAMENADKLKGKIRDTWEIIQNRASRKDLVALKEAIANLESLTQ